MGDDKCLKKNFDGKFGFIEPILLKSATWGRIEGGECSSQKYIRDIIDSVKCERTLYICG